MQLNEIVPFVAVGFLWGVTNPLIKRGSSGIHSTTENTNNRLYQALLELKFLVLRWQYILPFLLNQSGSLLYVYALQGSEISLAVPIAQSCTFLFTTLTALGLREQMPNKLSFFGIALISIGINICIFSKM
ncbi:transmembrane protein 234 homolog [Sitodiplosis mosellana]|uniref:transmembrane protein 234 homolog n=1 Tax=Sitodiplosis mosellana TaxID=263140 RepID=UPI002443B101|nr:transmembrane protein 234 homolog [Sitodiplosis mosellana]